jgi:erythromycin 3''-O-methyltransferase
MEEISTHVTSSIGNIIELGCSKLIHEPMDKIIQMLQMFIQIVLCIVIIVVIPCITIIMVICYFAFIYMNEKFNTYKSLIRILKSVAGNEKSNFMNYGYWDKPNMTLEDANRRLCKMVFMKGDLKNAKRILDVGCGYGEQDFYWAHKTQARIEGIDIDETSIRNAQAVAKEAAVKGDSRRNIKFETGNACMLDRKDATYDRVVSLESAFHYPCREDFFKEAYRVLKKGGKLVMADILYNDTSSVNIFNTMNRNAFSEMFNIPTVNKIGVDEYTKQLEDIGFRVKVEDISLKTFKPYYKYFFENVTCPDNFGLPAPIFSILRFTSQIYINTLCGGTNGFTYVLTVCEK